MKSNDIHILLATAAFSFLFYEQWAGFNYFLFNILLIALLLIRDRSLLLSPAFLAAAAGCVVSSACVFWYGTTLPLVADVISLILLAGMSMERGSSFIIAWFHSLYSLLTAFFYIIFDTFNGINSVDNGEGARKTMQKVFLAVIPVVIFLVFFSIYYNGNPIFAKLADRINFDFISLPRCAFTLCGFILMYGFFRQRIIGVVRERDHDTPDNLGSISAEEHDQTRIGNVISVSNLVYTGVLLIILLNLLLATVNGLDILYLGILHRIPSGITFSQYLHNGTDSLILSIVLAVVIILFYFRGYLNFHEGSRWLRWLAYIWIIQNIVLVISTAYRNTVYISDYGLTHRRIGVYVYLFLCVAGLVTTFIKIKDKKNNWFLFRKNAWIVYSFMILSCPVDWDSVITTFNINQFQYNKTMEIDQRYLADLGYTNLAQIFDYYIVRGQSLHAQTDSMTEMPTGRMSMESERRIRYTDEIRNMIWQKYAWLEHRYAGHSWPSHCMSKSDNLHVIERMMKEHNIVCPANYGYAFKNY